MSVNGPEPTITVITPTFNRSAYLKRAISSVLNQTYKNFELIVIDDFSTDDTEELVNQIKDPRVRYEKLEKNMGAPAARNHGIRLARGRYISFLDSDDEYLPEKLELQITKIIEAPEEIGVVYCGYHIVYEPDIKHGEVSPKFKGNIFNTLLKHNCLGSPTPLVKKECFDNCGLFDETLPSCQDWDMWLRISEKYNFDYIDIPLSKAYTHGDQISTNINNKIIAREILIEKYKNLIGKHPETKSYLLQKLGFLHFLDNNRFSSLKYYLQSILSNPRDVDNFMILITSILSEASHMERMKKSSIRQENDITVYF